MLKNSTGLHVPEPSVRPGESTDFSHFEIPLAGSVAFIRSDCRAEDMRDYPFKLIRVLSDDYCAVGDWDPRLESDRLIAGLRAMMLTRAYDNRMVRVQRQGKTSFYMKCTGEEAVAVAAAMALEPADMCFPTYRQQGLLVARDWSLVDMMNQVYSNSRDRLKGRQMPVFYSSREAGFFSISGNLGTQYSQAVGWAMGAASDDSSSIAAAWIGEGATAEGDFFRCCLPGPSDLQHREQSVGYLLFRRNCRWRTHHLRSAWARLRHSCAAGRRKRLPRGLRRHCLGRAARAGRTWPHSHRAFHLPRRRPLYLG
jgi:2-oxoisovalerate dehydrogenase E1 component alpha subunit